MEEENRGSHLLKGFHESLTLARDTAILAILAVLVFDASRITPILTKIGLALEKAGFTEVNVGGVKQNLTRLREKAQDTGLNTQQAQESLANAITALKNAQSTQPSGNVASNIKDAITFISSSQQHLGFIKQQIQEATGASAPGNSTQIQSVPSNRKSWIVVVGADRTLKAAQAEVVEAEARGFKEASILFREDWYRTVIPFATEQQAAGKLAEISARIREGSFIRDLSKWCGKLEARESGEGRYDRCTPLIEG